ncbi:IS1634 family transposase [Fodinisporobacter ferrooxydans]|uniref:IS1634 family transposase n=2 Tax=Fodinisporobacter ferrooxydans TaxID=2901836 RepID=A0ABY4CL08_9BACL|nr:IS1634 family transposase [Alicyclobacillaceae bacterium MYW30-H2]
MELGTLTLPKSDWRKLAAVLESRLAGQESLFTEDATIVEAADAAMKHYHFVQTKSQEKQQRHEQRDLVTIDLQSIATSEYRSLGPELVAHTFWEHLGFNQILQNCGLSTEQQALAQAVIIGRLVAPSSDLASWNWLRNQTALLELLPVDLSNIRKDAVYEIADILLAHKDKIEKALRDQEALLFPSQTTLFLYDLTNTYFEGQCKNNALAKRGNSKEQRTERPLVTLALVVDQRGFPIFSRIYGGNQSEPQTLPEILKHLYVPEEPQLFSQERPTIVMDRGIATKETIQLLKSVGYPYLIVERRAVEKEYVQEFEQAKTTFEPIGHEIASGTVYVKKLLWENGSRVLCLSVGREQKEQAMDALKEERFLQDLGRLQASVTKGNIQLVEKVGERVGRLKERYPSTASHYDIVLQLDDAQKKVTTVTYDKKESRVKRQTLTGCYVIETSHQDLAAADIWRLYTTLTKIEEAFRSLKTDLGMRPVYHQQKSRTEGHLFISVLAYHLLICIEKTLAEQDDHRQWSTVCKALSTYQRSTIILTDDQDQIHHVRISSTPESAHQEIYRLLNVKDPLKRKHTVIAKRL